MKILSIGGTGVISTAVTRLALSQGIEVTLLNRGSTDFHMDGTLRTVRADIRDPAAVRQALAGMRFDAVVDWIAFTPEHCRTDYSLFAGKTDQYIFISTCSAYQKPNALFPITESTPLHNPYWRYSQMKAECEHLLFDLYKKEGFPVTVVRPSSTYNEQKVIVPVTGATTNWTYLKRMLDGKPTVVPGDGTNLWTITHSTDFAKGFVGLLGNFAAVGQAFHITSDEALPWNHIVGIQAKILGVEPNLIHIPADLISMLYPEFSGSLLGDKAESTVFDNSKIKSFVPSFICTTPFSMGARRYIEEYLSNPELQVEDEQYTQKMDNLIDRYQAAIRQML